MTKGAGPTIDRAMAATLLDRLTEVVVQAGAAILAIDRRAMTTDGKSDGSPVTAADLAADRVIADGLACLLPDVPVLSEERAPPPALSGISSFFLIDPLDGTKEFIAGRDEF